MGRQYPVHLYDLVDCIPIPALVVKRLYRFGNLAFFKVLDSSVILRLELVYLVIGRPGIRIGHLASVGPCGRVFRIESGGHLERHGTVCHLCLQTVKYMECLFLVIYRVFRLQENMTGIEHVPFLFEHFDNMESVRGLHNLGNHSRLERHGGIRECRPENGL